MNLQHRSYQKELLDEHDIPFEDIRRNMYELDVINTWLGGHKITIKGFRELCGSNKSLTVCEIGCGGGDNLAAIKKWCDKKNILLHCIGIDIKKECIATAKENKVLQQNSEWIESNYKQATFKQKPDIIFSSLFCHHFTEDELVQQLQWMQANSRRGFFINDLHRHILAYHSIRLLTKFFSKSYLVKNDAPLSVARGFTKQEWKNIFSAANIHSYKLNWKWAFRFMIIYKHEPQSL